ncbi:MAG TPA: tandem-95 repeat protein [Baekduia sp.]|uniref:tandem-95 repeat protein n=1 Tax=Baekduia sp. TaxID=2600305 RepID=UPI002D77BA5E|nr:tandem-95 repeat protein [Baekduia sp.]HET6509767.1 tandem-95 repeat protein [Baekduia sp.]
MRARPSAGARGLGLALAAVLPILAVPTTAPAAVSRTAATAKALKALDVSGDRAAVRVFATRATVPARTTITQSAARAGAATTTDRDTGVRTAPAARVARTPAEPVWLFYADRGPFQAFEHPGRIALVGARTGRVTLTATLRWVPLVGGRLPEFFRGPDAYEGKRFLVYDRPWPATPSAAAVRRADAADAAEADRRAAAALAAQHACALRVSDTLGDFYDFGRVDRTRAQLGLFLKRLSTLAPGFLTERYVAHDGTTPSAAAQRLIDRGGCRDLLLYAAGGAARTGAPGVVVGVRAAAGGRIAWQTLTAADLARLVKANPSVRFSLIFDAPYTGRMAAVLRGEPNVSALLTSGGPDEPSFRYLPAVTGAAGVVQNPGNPQHLLEFTNTLIGGLGRFVSDAAEVDHAVAQPSASFLGWMLGRAVGLAAPPFDPLLTTPIEVLPATTAPPAPAPAAPAPPATTPTPTPEPPAPPVNHAPIAVDAAHATDEDTPVSFTLEGSDPDGDPLTFAVTAPPAHGTVTAAGPRVTYTPAPDFNGTDRFTYTISDGRGGTATGTVVLTVAPVNDAPVLVASAGSATFTEDGPAVAVDPGVTVGDVDSATLASATVAISDGLDAAHDALAFSDTASIAGDYDAATGVLTLTGVAPAADYETALRAVTFTTTGDDPSTAPRTLTLRADDGAAEHHLSAPATRALTVVAVNDPPVLSSSATGAVAYTEDGPPATIDPTISIADPDSAQLVGAAISITAGHEADDRLRFTDTAHISGTYDAAAGILRLDGFATLAEYRDALRSVAYETVSDVPSTATRTIGFRVDDGAIADHLSNVVTRDVTVAAHDDGPRIATSPGSATFSEGGAAVAVDPALTVMDPEGDDLTKATVTIGADDLRAGDDQLSFTPQSGIIGTYVPSSGVLTLTGTATAAQYQAALRSVTFVSVSSSPGTARTIAFNATDDGGATGPDATRAIAIDQVNDAPVLDVGSGSTAFTEGDDPGPAVAPALTVSDADSPTLAGATVTITTNRDAATDVLDFADTATIAGTFDAATGTLELTGVDTLAHYQAALRSVRFRATGDNPDGATRTVSFVADDGEAINHLSTAVTRAVTVTPINDAPTITTGATHAAYTERGTAATVDAAVTVTDPDSTSLLGATVSIAAGFASGDTLSFTNGSGITGSYNTGTGLLTLTGTATLARYQAALRSITYSSTSHDPGTSRTIGFRATDAEGATSATATQTVDITPVADAPVVTTSGGSAAFRAGQSGTTTVDGGLTVTDADSADQAGATIRITSGYAASEDVLRFTDANGIAGTWDAATGTLTLAGSATTARYQAALRSITYDNTATIPDTADRVVTFTVSDTSGTASAEATRTVAVSVNQAPVVGPAGSTTFQETPLAPAPSDAVAIAADLDVTDADSANLVGATVTLATPRAEDVLAFVDTPNITGTYDAAAGVLTLTGTDTVANYQAALRAVTYRDTSDDPDTTDRIATFVVDDGEGVRNLSAPLDRTIQIVAVDDPPVAGSPSFAGSSRAVGNTTLLVHDPANGAAPAVTGPRKQVSGNLLATATDPDSTDLTVVPATAKATTHGGTVDLYANGDFALHPAAGYTGDETFAYTVDDGDGKTGSGTATVNVQDPVWYVDANAAAGGDGRSDHPLNALTALNGAGGSGDSDAANDTIFLYPGTYDGGLRLENGQQLVSQRAGLAVGDGGSGSVTLVPSAPAGVGSTVAGGLTLATSNRLDGVDLGSTAGTGAAYALTGTSVGTLTMNPTTSATIDNPAGGAISIGGTGNVLGVALATLSSSGSTGRGVWITGAKGTLTAAAGTIAGATAADVQLTDDDGLTATLGTTISDTAGTLVDVADQNAGTVTFAGPISGTTTGAAVSLSANAGATLAFTGGVDVTATGATPALSATGGGVLTVTGASNRLTGAAGGALAVRNTTIGSAGLTFQKLAASGAANAVVLDTTGSTGGLTVTGTGVPNSGGTIQGASGAGVLLNAVGAPVSLTDMKIDGGGDDGLRATNVTGGLTLATDAFTNNGNATGERGLDLTGVTGTIALTNPTISGNAEDGLRLVNGSGTAALSIAGGTISDQSAVGTGNDGVQVVGTGSGSQSVTIGGGTTFSNNRGDHVQVLTDTGSTATQTISISGTSMTSPAGGILGGGITISPAGSGAITSTITNNTITGAMAGAIVNTIAGGSSTLRSTITNNTTTSPGADGVQLYARAAGTLTALVSGNVLRTYDFAGVEIQQGDGNGAVNATVKANTITAPAVDAVAGIYAEVGTTTGDSGTSCLDVGDTTAALANRLGGSLAADGISDLYLAQRESTTAQLPGYAGGAVPAYLVARNNGNSTPTAKAVGTFTAGPASCPQP